MTGKTSSKWYTIKIAASLYGTVSSCTEFARRLSYPRLLWNCGGFTTPVMVHAGAFHPPTTTPCHPSIFKPATFSTTNAPEWRR